MQRSQSFLLIWLVAKCEFVRAGSWCTRWLPGNLRHLKSGDWRSEFHGSVSRTTDFLLRLP